MAKKNNYDINAKINAVFNQVDVNSITPQEVKDLLQDIKDSYSNLTDHIDLMGLREYDESRSEPYAAGQAALHEGRIAISKFGYSGVFNPSHFNLITPKQPLYELPLWNSTPKAIGYLARFEGNAYRNDVTNNTNEPPNGWTSVDVSSGYFGEAHQVDTVYIPGQIVLATVDERKVYLRCSAPSAFISSNVASEWQGNQWEYFSEAAMNSPIMLGAGQRVLNKTDHGKVFLVESGDSVQIALNESLPTSFFCKIIAIESTANLDFTTDAGLIVSANGTRMTGYGKVEVYCVGLTDGGSVIFQLSGDLTNVE